MTDISDSLKMASKYDSMIKSNAIRSTLYTDPSIYEEELDKIFYRGWVFIGHESELLKPGDYIRRDLGRQTLVLVRGQDNVVRVFHNVCTHRSSLVVLKSYGNTKFMACPYHGWVYNLQGQLIETPQPAGYGDDFKKEDHGMKPVAEMGTYRGFIFVKLIAGGITLDEHLGSGKKLIDMACDLSPEGEIQLTAGWTKHKIRANWKTQPDNNGCDGYHVGFVHGSFAMATGSQVMDQCVEESKAIGRYWGKGHFELDFRTGYASTGRPFEWFGRISPSKLPNYISAMEEAYGKEKATDLFLKGPPHAIIFPNLFLGELNIVFTLPTAVNECVQLYTPMLLKGAPEVNGRALRQSEGAVTPASFIVPDDIIVAEGLQIAAESLAPGWLDLSRGENRERLDEDGMKIGDMSDETPNRGFWQHYKELMSSPN